LFLLVFGGKYEVEGHWAISLIRALSNICLEASKRRKSRVVAVLFV